MLKLDVTGAGVTKQKDLRGHWAEKYVNALSQAGYVQGFPDGTFKPGTPITRAQAVVLINRIAGTKKLTVTSVQFKDLPATHWAYKDIMSVVK
ncbi:S-layer homology domain-containing protein [Paenibacillus rhizoplanae]